MWIFEGKRGREMSECVCLSIESYKLCLIHFNKLDTLDYTLTRVNDDTVQRMKAIVSLNLVQTHYSKVYIVTIKIGRMIQMMRQREREGQRERERGTDREWVKGKFKVNRVRFESKNCCRLTLMKSRLFHIQRVWQLLENQLYSGRVLNGKISS